MWIFRSNQSIVPFDSPNRWFDSWFIFKTAGQINIDLNEFHWNKVLSINGTEFDQLSPLVSLEFFPEAEQTIRRPIQCFHPFSLFRFIQCPSAMFNETMIMVYNLDHPKFPILKFFSFNSGSGRKLVHPVANDFWVNHPLARAKPPFFARRWWGRMISAILRPNCSRDPQHNHQPLPWSSGDKVKFSEW